MGVTGRRTRGAVGRRPVAAQPARIEIDIEELVVDGFDPIEARGLAHGVRMALERLLVERGLPRGIGSGRQGDTDSTGTYAVRLNQDAAAVGEAAGTAVFEGLDG